MNELNDNELLEFLMTSEFDGEYRPEEFKFLLYKFRYFYRILHGKNSTIMGQKDLEIETLKREINLMRNTINEVRTEKAKLQDSFDLQPSTKKLTWWERIKGEVNLKNNN